MGKVIYKDLVRSTIQAGEWEFPTPLIGEFPTTLPTPTQAENDVLGATPGAVPMIKTWDLAPVDPQSFDPFEPPGRPAGPPTPPAPTAAPVVTGGTLVGNVLTTTDGTWTGTPPINYTRQWRRDATNRPASTGPTITLIAGDLGAMISCNVSASNAAGGPVTASSNSVGPITDVMAGNTTPPQITVNTDLVVGSQLSCDNGSWSGSNLTYAKQWWRDTRATPIAGATGNNHTLVGADVDTMIGCTVTATNTGGSSSEDADPVGPITATAQDPGVQPTRQPQARRR
jgi:hypothetical protein